MRSRHTIRRSNSTGSWIFLILAVVGLSVLTGCSSIDLSRFTRIQEEADESLVDTRLLAAFRQQREAERKAAMVEQTYGLEDLLANIQMRCGEDEKGAKDTLIDFVLHRCSIFFDDESRPNLAADGYQWAGGNLTILATPEEHEEIAATIETLRKQGIDCVVLVEMRFVVASAVETEPIIGGWNVGDLSMASQEGLDGSLPNGFMADGLRAKRTIEQRPTVRYKVLDEETTFKFLNHAEGDRRISRMAPPKMCICSGRSATLRDVSERLFTTGAENGCPRLQMVEEGTVIRVRPWLLENDMIRLEWRLTMSEVEESQTGKQPVARIPVVKKLDLEEAVQLHDGQSLLISGVEPDSSNSESDHGMMLMLTVRRWNPEAQKALLGKPAVAP